MYDPYAPKTAEDLELEEIVSRLAYQMRQADEDSAEYKMIVRQLEGIRHGSELGGLLMEEVDASGDIWSLSLPIVLTWRTQEPANDRAASHRIDRTFLPDHATSHDLVPRHASQPVRHIDRLM